MLQKKNIIFYLKLATVVVFIGRGYQYLFFGAPFRTLLWDEDLLRPMVESWFGISWNDYATNLIVDQWIDTSIQINGVLFLLAALATIFIKQSNKKLLRIPIFLGGAALAFLAFLTLKERFYQWGQFFELSIQLGIPFVLLYAIKKNVSISRITIVLKLLVGFTFIAHGLYAVGYYAVPGHFIDMTISTFGVNESLARMFIKVAGILDFVISILIFVPKVSKYALLYAFVWGTITALARVVSFYNPDFINASFHQTLYLVCYRLPHGIVPLLILLIQEKRIFKMKSHINFNIQ